LRKEEKSRRKSEQKREPENILRPRRGERRGGGNIHKNLQKGPKGGKILRPQTCAEKRVTRHEASPETEDESRCPARPKKKRRKKEKEVDQPKGY